MIKYFYLTHRYDPNRCHTTPGQSEPEGNGYEGVFHLLQSSRAGTSLSDGLVSYPGHIIEGGSYPFAEMKSMYSIAPADWASKMTLKEVGNRYNIRS